MTPPPPTARPAAPNALWGTYAVDHVARDEGVWRTYEPGVEIRIRSNESAKWRAAVARIHQRMRHEQVAVNEAVDAAQALEATHPERDARIADASVRSMAFRDALNLAVLSEASITGWRFPRMGPVYAAAIPDAENRPLACAPENIRRVLEAMPELRDRILADSVDATVYRAYDLEAMAGNSAGSSPTSSGEDVTQ